MKRHDQDAYISNKKDPGESSGGEENSRMRCQKDGLASALKISSSSRAKLLFWIWSTASANQIPAVPSIPAEDQFEGVSFSECDLWKSGRNTRGVYQWTSNSSNELTSAMRSLRWYTVGEHEYFRRHLQKDHLVEAARVFARVSCGQLTW